MTLFDEVLHIPLIMVIPGTPGGKKITTQVRSMDIIPTIFSLIGKIPDPQFGMQLRGTTLVPALTGKDLRLNVFAETSYRYATFQKAVRTYDQWKLIMDEESQMKQLYDINKDPKETEDLFSGGSTKASELIDALYTHSASLQQTKNP
jgi:arylsulfatase A-like enzyme